MMRGDIERLEDMKHIEDDHERIILLRKRLKMSQYQFAKKLDISVSYLGQVENYKLPVTKQIITRIDEFLKREKELHEKDILSHF